MLIETLIQPRKTGDVCLQTPVGSRYVFSPDASGRLVTEIEDEQDLAFVLSRGDVFMPADEHDLAVAGEILQRLDSADDEDDDEDDDDGHPDAPPVESSTAPKARRGRKPGVKADLP